MLGDLINLNKIKVENKFIRALNFQLFENNGVKKRSEIEEIINSINSNERKIVWKMGIKIGRYHVYLPKMLKPKAVSLRISLWKLFYQSLNKNKVPQSGLNF